MSVARKTAVIMLGMMSIEGWVLWLSFQRSTRGQIAALYDPIPSGWLACALAVAVSAFYVGYAIRAFPVIGERFLDLGPLKFLAVPFAAITGSMEELWFRKAAMDSVQMHGGGILLQIAVSATLFGLIHAVWGVFAGKWRVAMGSMIATGGLGAALAIIYLVGGRQLAPCVWAHIAINLAIEPWLLLAAVSGRLPAATASAP
jgi:uncharacterized protein